MDTPRTYQGMMPEPSEIYQDFLDETSAALLRGDPTVFCDRVALPFVMRTADGEIILESRDDLLEDTQKVVQAMREMQVTDYIRLVRKARYLDENTIEGWHKTYVMHNANTVTPPYHSRLVFRRQGETWRVALAEHELQSRTLPVSIMRSQPGVFEAQWDEMMDSIASTQARAEPVYAAYLASLDKTNHAHDFEAWTRHYAWPTQFHLPDSDHVITDPETVRGPVFENQCNMAVDGKPARIERRVKHAEFLNDDRIIGYHDTVWLADGDVVHGPVACRMILREEEGRLIAEHVSNTLRDDLFESGTLAHAGTLPTIREIQRRRRP